MLARRQEVLDWLLLALLLVFVGLPAFYLSKHFGNVLSFCTIRSWHP
jgi:hypothetical protein